MRVRRLKSGVLDGQIARDSLHPLSEVCLSRTKEYSWNLSTGGDVMPHVRRDCRFIRWLSVNKIQCIDNATPRLHQRFHPLPNPTSSARMVRRGIQRSCRNYRRSSLSGYLPVPDCISNIAYTTKQTGRDLPESQILLLCRHLLRNLDMLELFRAIQSGTAFGTETTGILYSPSCRRI